VQRRLRFLSVALLALAIVGVPAAALGAEQTEPAAHRAVHPAVAALPGDVNDFTFRSFNAVYDLGRDDAKHATLAVKETIVALFPQSNQNRGILRDIPNVYGSADLQTKVVSVVDEKGADVPFTEDDQGDVVELALGTEAYVHGATTYVISYTQADTIRHFPNTDDDEFYWDVNGNGWGQPFQQVGAQVVVDPSLSSALTGHNACYQGAQGSTTPCSSGVVVDGSTLTALTTDLAPGDGLTVAIGFTSGTFVDVSSDPNNQPGSGDSTPATPAQIAGVLLSLLGFPAALIGVISGVVSRLPRTEPARGTIIPQYSVPGGIDVMVAAELIARPATAVPAQFVSLSVKGKTRLLGYAVKEARASDYSIQLLDPTGLDPIEQQVVDALFGAGAKPGATHDLRTHGDDALADALAPALATARTAVAAYYDGHRRTVGGTIALVITVALTLTALLSAVILGGFVGLVTGFIGIVAGLIGVGAAYLGFRGRRKLSDVGAQWNDYLLGMRMYLQLAEQDRLRVLQSPTGAERIDTADGKQLIKLYEKLLPWAIIWGVEDQWSKVLEVELQRQNATPDFWVGQNAFSALTFLPLLTGLGPATSAVPMSTSGSGGTFSSFSGGSFGGGFSGGGGGGGGGGGR
jgi:uncharacterized membrane protein YgcG